MRAGQKVVCVKSPSQYRPFPETHPIEGEIYTIRDVRLSTNGVRLKEIVNPPHQYFQGFHEMWFSMELFRPVDETFGEQVAESIEEVMKEQPEHLTA